MKVWLVLEGQDDLAVMKALLPRETQAAVEFIVVGPRSNVSSVARTLLVKHREPVAVVMDTDTLDAATIWDKYSIMEHLLRSVSSGVPFKVILCIPVLEAVFFTSPEILKRTFPEIDLSAYLMFYDRQPKEAFAFLLSQGGGPATLEDFLAALTDADADSLRASGPIRELIDFVSVVTSTLSATT